MVEGEETEENKTDLTNEIENDNNELQQPIYDEVTQTLINEADAARLELENILKKISDNENNIRFYFK